MISHVGLPGTGLLLAASGPGSHCAISHWRAGKRARRWRSSANEFRRGKRNTNHDQGTGFGDEVIHQKRETRIKDEQTETDPAADHHSRHPRISMTSPFAGGRAGAARQASGLSGPAQRVSPEHVLEHRRLRPRTSAASATVSARCWPAAAPDPDPSRTPKFTTGAAGVAAAPSTAPVRPDKLGRQGRRRKGQQQDGDFGGRYAAGRTSLGGRPRQPVITPGIRRTADLPGGAGSRGTTSPSKPWSR